MNTQTRNTVSNLPWGSIPRGWISLSQNAIIAKGDWTRTADGSFIPCVQSVGRWVDKHDGEAKTYIRLCSDTVPTDPNYSDSEEVNTPTPAHTALPWIVVGEFVEGQKTGELIARLHDWQGDAERQANAALIVRAVNSHAAMVDALPRLDEWAQFMGGFEGPAWVKARAALKLATEGTR